MGDSEVEDLLPARVDRLLAGPGSVIIEFWGPWCGPCRDMAPVLSDVGRQLGDRAVIGKVDISAHAGLASRFRVMSVPTFIRFEGGAERARHPGTLSRAELMRFCGAEPPA